MKSMEGRKKGVVELRAVVVVVVVVLLLLLPKMKVKLSFGRFDRWRHYLRH